MSSAPIPDEHQYRAKWRWPADIEAMIRRAATGYTLHVCCGKSPLGDVRVDADNEHDPDVEANMKNLPFPDGTFDSVVWDPPWKMAYFDRYKPFYEAVRVCKRGGRVIVNAKWVCESQDTEVINPFDTGGDDEVIFVRADDAWRDASILTIHEKVAEQTSLEAFIGEETDAVPTRPRPNRWDYCNNCGEQFPVDELDYESDILTGQFCSASCLHDLEDRFGEPLTPVDDPCPHVAPAIRAEWATE